jgi:predicted HicB family RNase H-like nuclease
MIEYKGYVGVFEFDEDLGEFHGFVVNTQDVITFYGSSVEELREELKDSVEVYLAFCAEKGKKGGSDPSGRFNLLQDPTLLQGPNDHLNAFGGG